MPDVSPSRRLFLTRCSSLAAGLFAGHGALLSTVSGPGGLIHGGLSSRLLHAADEPRPARTAAQLVAGKNDKLKVLEQSPIVLETPLSQLAAERVTSAEWLFVRNNQDLEQGSTLQPLAKEDWSIELSGLSQPNVLFRGTTLADLPQVEYEMVLQCSGNTRYRFAESVAVPGTSWGSGGVGNVRLGGVPLRKVLEHYKVEPAAGAKFLTAGGRDLPPPKKDDFEHSLPIDTALNESFLAITLNGEPLPAIHGGPVRLVTPGYFATLHMKWLTSLQFSSEESRRDSHANRYRMPNSPIEPGSPYKFNLQNSRANGRMNVKSLILFDEGQRFASQQAVPLQGVAFNDGQCAIETVLISIDQGASWTPARLDRSKSSFAWTVWQLPVTLRPGNHEVWSRAVDAWGRSQPMDGRTNWNPNGYEFNAVDRRKFIVV